MIRPPLKSLSQRAFTLIEVLVATSVFALMLGIALQMISSTATVTNASNKRMDAASMARIALDRIETDFNAAILNAGATALYYGDSGSDTGNSSIAWATKSRSRFTADANINQEVRGAVVGYQVRNLPYRFGTTSVLIPTLQRGDGRVSFRRKDAYDKTDYSFARMFGEDVIANDLENKGEVGLNFQGLGDGIVGFHISFLQDNGTVVQVPPTYVDFRAVDGTGSCIPVAFSKANVAAGGRYVQALIVGVAVLDETTFRTSYERDAKFTETIAAAIKRPMKAEETPVAVWSANFQANAGSLPRPILQALRFHQRVIPANL